MDFDQFRNSVYLEGPDEIRPVLRALGDSSAFGQVYAPDELVEITAQDATIACTVLFERSWSANVSYEEGARMRSLSDDLGVLVIRRGQPVQPPVA
jgi:hypothetical protein